MRKSLLALIRLYQALISPALGVACRYEPSCSNDAREAIRLPGAWRGTGMSLRRLSRCRPGGGSGYDPVPDHQSELGEHIAADATADVPATVRPR